MQSGQTIDYMGIRNILHALKEAGWSAQNIVFGMGGGLLQKINRDTQRFAFKSSAQMRNGEWHDIFKKPKDISKMSKRGRLFLYYDNGGFETTNIEDGELLVDHKFDDIRERAKLAA